MPNKFVNSNKFTQKDIFEGIESTQVKVGEYSCQQPLFYHGNRGMVGMFLASSKRIKKYAPNALFKPISVFPGISLITVVAFDFNTGIGPVKEFYVGIPVKRPGLLPFGLGALQEILDGYMPIWTMHLPVSTDIAYQSGVSIYGFPKTLADISYDDTEKQVISEVKYQDKIACRLTGLKKKKPGKLAYRLTVQNVLWQNGTMQTCDHAFDLKGMSISFPGKVKLETFSDAPIAMELNDILLSKKAISSIYVPKLKALLCEPDRVTPWLIDKLQLGKNK